jgi:hypothetical protein
MSDVEAGQDISSCSASVRWVVGVKRRMVGEFLDFYNSLDRDPGKRGKQFERFVKWFLQADPAWSTQVERVWLWDEYPDRWGVDCGVDLMWGVIRHLMPWRIL